MRGFTMIEIVVGIAIAGILAALAVPSYRKVTCKAQQSEAHELLGAVVAIEEGFRAEHDRYVAVAATCTPAQRAGSVPRCISFQSKGNARFSVAASVTTAGFRVTATGKPRTQMAGAVWRMDQTRTLTDVTRTCR